MYYSFIYFNILTVFYSYLMFIIPLRLYIVLVEKKKKNHLSKSIKAKPYFIAGIFFFFNVSFLRAWLELQTCCVFLQIKLLVFTVCFYVLQH